MHRALEGRRHGGSALVCALDLEAEPCPLLAGPPPQDRHLYAPYLPPEREVRPLPCCPRVPWAVRGQVQVAGQVLGQVRCASGFDGGGGGGGDGDFSTEPEFKQDSPLIILSFC